MGYACPVCETPQADAGHLANHLAITAIARGGDHEAWLDEHVPDWADLDEEGLAERVVEHAEAADYPQVFEDTSDQTDAPGDGLDAEAMARLAETDLEDAETEAIVERARELTRQRREDSETE